MRLSVLITSAAALALAAPAGAWATSLDEAIALALKSNPDMVSANADVDMASARVREAQGAALPQVTLSGSAGTGRADLGGFFGFGKSDIDPRAAQIEVRQPLFTGGALLAGIDQAKQGRDASLRLSQSARAGLTTRVAQAYGGVLSAASTHDMVQTYLTATEEVSRQAELRFKAGEIPRSELAQAQARLADGRAQLARARAFLAEARAQYHSVVGQEPDHLEPLPLPLVSDLDLDAAMAQAEHGNPDLAAAQAAVRAARDGVRMAEAEHLPSLALTASASTLRDQFFPGYRSDGTVVGVQGRWTLFAGGAINARIAEARAGLRKAQANQSRAESAVRQGVVTAWNEVRAAHEAELASADQLKAASAALDSLRNEVRVGQKTTLDLLNAQRDELEARAQHERAKVNAVVASYRLKAVLGDAS
jgi:TolC family type I secretion outer membrane protein